MTEQSIINGWHESSDAMFWSHHKDGKWTGLTIAKIPPWPPENPVNRKTVFHVRFYPPSKPNKDYDIGDAPTLAGAKRLAKSYLDRMSNNVV